MLAQLDDGQQTFGYNTLRDHRFELVVDDVAGVDLFVHITPNHVLRQLEHAAFVQLLQHGRVAADNSMPPLRSRTFSVICLKSAGFST